MYGLGATLVYAATGRRVAELSASAGVREEVRAAIGDDRVARVLDRMVRPDPDARPASAAEAARLLRATRPRSRWIALAAIVAALIATGAALAWLDAREDARAQALAEARAALARHDLDATEAALARCDPASAEAASLRALTLWWRGRDDDAVTAAIDHALALDPALPSRELLTGVRLLASSRLEEAQRHFDRVVAREPDDVSARYGAFEARWHRGDAPGALEEHERIVALDPDFTLGIEHALVHHLARGELDAVDRTLARSNAVPSAERQYWLARALMARGRHDDAVAELERLVREQPTARMSSYAMQALVQAHLARSDPQRARAATTSGAEVDRHLARYAIAVARADERAGAARDAVLARIARGPSQSFVISTALVAIELGRGPEGDLEAALDVFERVRKDDARTRMIDLLTARRRGDRRAIERARSSTTPEVALAAQAALAEGAEAAALWERAADASHDGTFRALELYEAAALHRASGDHEGVVRSCRGVVDPPLLHWGSVPLLRACLDWTARAHEALTRPTDAAAARARLDALSR